MELKFINGASRTFFFLGILNDEACIAFCDIMMKNVHNTAHASSLRMPREKKCPAGIINEFELHDSP